MFLILQSHAKYLKKHIKQILQLCGNSALSTIWTLTYFYIQTQNKNNKTDTKQSHRHKTIKPTKNNKKDSKQ